MLVFLRIVLAASVVVAASGYTGWNLPVSLSPTSDVLNHAATFAKCYYSGVKSPTHDCRWAANLNRRVDEKILGGTIIAYQIQWFNGGWSPIFVPGHNDISPKFNPFDWATCPEPYKKRSLRRRWAMFFDHKHWYIICQ